MFLLDESLFRLWKNGLVDKEEALLKTSKPVELAAKMAMYEKGILDEDEEGEDVEDEEGDTDYDEDEDEEEEEEEEERPRHRRR